jgi:hypothetical protein
MFLKAVGLTAAAVALPTGLGASVAIAAPAAGPGLGALELWLLDTGAGTLEAGLYGASREQLAATVSARGEALPY